jgi:hypothetical protein
MCVCAGLTGAAVVPTVKAAKAAWHRPAARHAPARSVAIIEAPCIALPPAPALAVAPVAPIADAMPDLGPLLADDTVWSGTPAPAAAYAGIYADDGFFGGWYDGIGGGASVGGHAVTPPGKPLSVNPVVAPHSAVPEPSTWAMLIAGFGLTGAVARYRQAFA